MSRALIFVGPTINHELCELCEINAGEFAYFKVVNLYQNGDAFMDDTNARYSNQTFGNYHLLKLLGVGGFSEVYLGTHVHLETMAAVKVLQTRLNEDEFARFRQEAQTLIGLGHPHIVRILDFGLRDGIPFLVMSYAPNGSLRDRYPAGSRLPLETVVALVKQISSALHYAHEHSIVHRDIKPDNLLLGENDEVLLSDFGIAVIAHNTYSMKTQEAIGTVAYMAPEQLRRKARPASDQYALGIVVYEWLCGEPPFDGEPIQVALQHLTETPPPLRAVRPDISSWVEDVVLKALAREPQDRFPSIQAFSDALEQASQTTEVGAFRPAYSPQHTPSPHQKERPSLPAKPARRAFLVGGLLVAGSAIATGLGIWQLSRAHSGPSLVTGGNTTLKPETTPSLIPGGTSTRIPDTTRMDDVVTGVAWSPGGWLYASTDGSGHVRVWDVNQRLQWERNLGIKLWSLSWSPDGLGAQRLAVAGDDGKVRIFDALSGEQTLLYAGHGQTKVLSVTWPLPIIYSPFTNVYSILNLVASGDINGTIQVWNPDTGEIRRKMVQAAPVTGLAFGNAFVVSVGTPPGGTWSVWSLERPQDVHYINNTENFINTSSVSTGGAPIAAAKAATMTAVGWSNNMQYLCIGDSGGHLLVSEMGQQWRWPCYFLGAKGQINAVCWSTITNECATASDDGTVQIWKFPNTLNYAVKVELSPEKTWTPGGRIKSLAWSPDGKYLLAGNETGQLKFLSV